MKKVQKTNNGFTIIEVALVLALAGLIFLMAFIALPQLQRSQRDAERKDDMMAFTEAVKKYMTNNRGTLPEATDDESNSKKGTLIQAEVGGENARSWTTFIKEYVDKDYGTDNQTFGDPRDGVYNVVVKTCGETTDIDGPCGENQAYGWDTTIHVFTQGVCEEDHAIKGSNPREFAVVYRTESSGVYCFDSSS